MNDIRIFLNIKNKRWLSVEKNITNEKKCLTLISIMYKKFFVFLVIIENYFVWKTLFFQTGIRHFFKKSRRIFSGSVKNWFFRKVYFFLQVENRFFQESSKSNFTLEFENLATQTKSAFILKYKEVKFYSLISIHPGV